MKNSFRCLFLLVILGTVSSCYRMPSDDDFSVVPTTNNPAVTCDRGDSLPGIGY